MFVCVCSIHEHECATEKIHFYFCIASLRNIIKKLFMRMNHWKLPHDNYVVRIYVCILYILFYILCHQLSNRIYVSATHIYVC